MNEDTENSIREKRKSDVPADIDAWVVLPCAAGLILGMFWAIIRAFQGH